MAKKKVNSATPENTEGAVPLGLDTDDLLKLITKKVSGAEILDEQTILEQGFINTSNLALNFICSGQFIKGGIPRGRVTEIFGPSSSAKTVIGTHVLQGCQKEAGVAVLLDSENAYSAPFAEALGINTKKLIYMAPPHLEACFAKTQEIANLVSKSGKKTPVCVVYDSIAASPSEVEYNDLMENKTSGPEMGGRARVCSKELRKIAGALNRQNCAMIIINQIRSKIGVMFGNPETTAGGGNSLEYYCSLRLDCRKKGILTDTRKRPTGILLTVKCIKNKCTTPFRKAENLRLYWDKGIDPCSGLLQILLDEDLIASDKPGWYYSTSNKDAKFQASKEDNYVSPKFLLENPEVLRATKEEVAAFLSWNSGAISESEGAVSNIGVDAEDDDPVLAEAKEISEEGSELLPESDA